MNQPTYADLAAELTAIRVMLERHMSEEETRLHNIEATQSALLTVATQGKAGLRVLLWIGGAMGAVTGLFIAGWSAFKH